MKGVISRFMLDCSLEYKKILLGKDSLNPYNSEGLIINKIIISPFNLLLFERKEA
jgi:hypothetical protein